MMIQFCWLVLRCRVVVFPFAAPSTEVLIGNSPLGSPHGCGELAKGQEARFANPQSTLRSAGNKRRSGGLFFGYFLLAMQKKVTRLSVRPIGRIADWHLPLGRKTGMFFVKPTFKWLRKANLFYKSLISYSILTKFDNSSS
ncbi:MAG: hypothetical protein RLZ92_1728 [Pseudomonadota bacterium]|jgi:hypothetical protein